MNQQLKPAALSGGEYDKAVSAAVLFPPSVPPSLHEVYFSRAPVTNVTATEETFARGVEGATDRQALFANADFQRRVVNYLDAQHARSPVDMVTFDVFDTVVLRNHKCEPRRFREIAKRQASLMVAEGQMPGTVEAVCDDLFVARIMATRVSYRVRRPVHGCREGSITDIYQGMVGSLGLGSSYVERLLDIEIAYEIESTTRNPLAVCIAHWADRVGARTALISDMYLHAPHIERIVTAHLQEDREMFGPLVSSADAVISKGSGRLFDQLVEVHGIEPGAHLHFGDNVRTDFKVPISKGWRACLLPVPLLERELIEQDYLKFVTELAEDGLDLGTWIKSGA